MLAAPSSPPSASSGQALAKSARTGHPRFRIGTGTQNQRLGHPPYRFTFVIFNAMSDETYYEVLGVSETATTFEIRVAYRDLLKKIHPDTVSTLSPELRRIAEDATKEVNEAHSVLSDGGKRIRYDRDLADHRRQSAPPAPPNSQNPPAGRGTIPVVRTARRWRRTSHRRSKRRSLRRLAHKHPLLALVMLLLLIFCAVFIAAYIAFNFKHSSDLTKSTPTRVIASVLVGT